MTQDELFYLSEEEYVKKYGKDMARTMKDFDRSNAVLSKMIDRSISIIDKCNKKLSNLK